MQTNQSPFVAWHCRFFAMHAKGLLHPFFVFLLLGCFIDLMNPRALCFFVDGDGPSATGTMGLGDDCSP